MSFFEKHHHFGVGKKLASTREAILRPNKKVNVFRVAGLKILGRVGTHIFLIIFFSGKNIISYILKSNA